MTTFSELELSVESAKPVEIFDIYYSGNAWHFTNDTEPLTFENNVYVPIPITRSETEDNGDAEKSNMVIRVSKRSTLIDVFKITPPSEPVTVTIRQYHRDVPILDPSLQTHLVWKGRVINVSWEENEMLITSESVFSSLLRIGVTRKYSRQCTHALYGTGCRLNKDDYKVTAKVSAVQGTKITLPHGKPDKWFSGGYITYRNIMTGATERRAVMHSDTSSVTISAYPLGLTAGSTEVTLYAGCDHIHSTCINKFHNIDNYGGQPYIPIMNPFAGSVVY